MRYVTESLVRCEEVQKALLKKRLGAAYRLHDYDYAEITMGAPITAPEYQYYKE